MAGTKRRMFLPTPEELRRTYGENATAAASVMGSVRPAILTVFALMAVIIIRKAKRAASLRIGRS